MEFEKVFLDKCATCFPFGIRVCNLLKSASYKPSEGILSNVFDSAKANTRLHAEKEERLRNLVQTAERFTTNGKNLPAKYSSLRLQYYKDFNFLLETFARLGDQLKAYPREERTYHLRNAVRELNGIVHNRILSRGHGKRQDQRLGGENIPQSPFMTGSAGLSAEQVAQGCPEAAGYSIHFPMQHCSDKIQRILQFVVDECEVLPSSAKTPYLLTVELLEQNYPCQSEKLYTQGHVVGTTALDFVRGRSVPYLPPKGSFSSQPTVSLQKRLRDSEQVASGVENGGGGRKKHYEIDRMLIGEKEANVALNPNVKLFARQDEVFGDSKSVSAMSIDANPYEQRDVDGEVKESEIMVEDIDVVDNDVSDGLGEDNSSVSGSDDSNNTNDDDCNDKGEVNRSETTSDGESTPEPSDNSHSDLRGGNTNGNYGHGAHRDYNAHLDGRYPRQSPIYSHEQTHSTPSSRSRYQPPTYLQQPRRSQASTQSHVPFFSSRKVIQIHLLLSFLSFLFFSLFFFSLLFSSFLFFSFLFFIILHLYILEFNFRKLFGNLTTSIQSWEEKKAIVQRNSAFGHLQGWVLKSFIVKVGDDLRKELLAMQLIELFQKIFKKEGLDIQLRPYQIICTGHSSGLVEFVEGACSIDNIKKQAAGDPSSLKTYFKYGLNLGEIYTPMFGAALQNFVKSLVGYSLITYLLQVKDRHNANIMVADDGSIFHIDFGFIFGDSPGFNMNFENAPFKLTKEYVELMGGTDSMTFKFFEDLMVNGFLALAKHREEIIAVVDLFYMGKRKGATESIHNRLNLRSRAEVLQLIRDSYDNRQTKMYDWFQWKSNNIHC